MQFYGFTARRRASFLCAALAALLLTGCSQPSAPVVHEATPIPLSAESRPEASPEASALPVEEEPDNTPTLLPETEDAGQEYLDNTLFLGDSNTVRFMMYSDGSSKTPFTGVNNTIGVVSMSAGDIVSLKCEEFQGMPGMYTMPESVKLLKPNRIIITFGTNNLSGSSTKADSFIKAYRSGLKAIREAYPYAAIIVNSIPPLDEKRENTNLYQSQIDAYNKAILQMCEQEGYKFLNSAEALKDPATGWAKKDYTLSDGVHLSKDGITALFRYIRTHAYLNRDRRPTPLGDIPTPKGVQPGLITTDPIAVRGARVNIEVTVEENGTAESSAASAKPTRTVTLTAYPDEGYIFDEWELVSGSAVIEPIDEAIATLTVGTDNDANGIVVRANFKTEEEEWEEWEVEVEPTCTKKGLAVRVSSWDNEEEKELDMLPHEWTDGPWSEWSGEGTQQTRTCTQTCSECKKTREHSEQRATPTPTPAPSLKPSPSPSAAPSPDSSPSPSPSAAPTEPPAATATPTPAPTAAPAATPTPEPTAAPTPTPEPAPAPTEVPAEGQSLEAAG